MSVSYRPEIDGFRALAVTTVVLFHAKIPGFAQGFIGVDIFFVISGFLITAIIARDARGKGFSYTTFMMRRIRRILPALAVVMAVSIPFAWWLMLPDPLENFGQSLVATTLSANNVLLWLTTGYWDLTSDYKPLLHTWSLGVEEQFYILYPFILVLALRLPLPATSAVLAALAALSFWLMQRTLVTDPAAGFYLIHTRAWQLLVGGIAGLLATEAAFKPRPILAGLGVAMVIASLLPFGFTMVSVLSLATFGAAAYLLWASSGNPVTWIFTRKPVIFVGLVSYSFYLWHQPVFAFLRVGRLEYPEIWHFAAGTCVALGLAVLSWRFVEQPFRFARTTSARSLGLFLGASLGFCVVAGLFFQFSNGAPGRLGYTSDLGHAGLTVEYNERVRTLVPSSPPAEADKPVVLVIGISFARDFTNVIIEAGLREDVTLLYRADMNPCTDDWTSEQHEVVARAQILIFASGNYKSACTPGAIAVAESTGADLYFVGPKNFGANLNPLIRYAPEERGEVRLSIPDLALSINTKQIDLFGDMYVDLMAVLSDDGTTIRVANDAGGLLTTDRGQLSEAGAVYLARFLPDLMPVLYDLSGRPDDARRN